MIRLSKEEKTQLRKPRRKILIIKLLGRSIGYNLLARKIMDLKQPKAMELVAMDNGYFLAKFYSSEDYNYAKFDGPWMIFGHCLTMRPATEL